jgi:very-short-patch-repair endonuclease
MNHAYPASGDTRSIEELAAAQHGLVSRSQLNQLGINRGVIDHRVAVGKWQRMQPGVYRIAGAPETGKQRLMAAVLWAGEGAVASHHAAAALHQLDGFVEGPIEISSTRALKSSGDSVVLHRVKTFGVADVTVVDGIPVTSAARTIVDLAGAVGIPNRAGAVGLSDLERALDSGLRQRMFTLTRMEWEIRQSRGKRGVKELTNLVEERKRYGVPETELERDFIRLIKRSALEMPQCQYRIAGVGRVDFVYPEDKLAIETDGYAWHSDPDAFQKDRARDQELLRLGWRVLRFTKQDIRDRPAQVIKLIGSLKAEKRRDE